MRPLVRALVSVAAIGAALSPAPAAGQASVVRACALLPKEQVRAILEADRQLFDMVAPREEQLGGNGSACSYQGAHVQIDPFAPAQLEALRRRSGAGWTAVPGVGDAAYFHERPGSDAYGELYARAGTRVVTVQVPLNRPGETARDARRRAAALATAVLARLR